jgi:hypothetical protein
VIQRGDRLNARVHRDPGTAWGVAGGWNPKTKALPSVGIVYRPDHAESELSDPQQVLDVEGGFREEATGNGASILEAARTGELEGKVQAIPIDDHDRVSLETLRQEGNPVIESQEVMFPIQSGRLEGETEISIGMSVYEDVKMSVYKDVNDEVQLSGSQTQAESVSALPDMSVYKDVNEEVQSSRSQTQAESVSALLDQSCNAQLSIETQSGKLPESDELYVTRHVNLTNQEDTPTFEGGKLSGSQTRADTVSALPDKDCEFRETIQSFNETRSSIPLELNDLSCYETCYQNLSASDHGEVFQAGRASVQASQSDFPVKATGASLGKTMPLRTLSMSRSSNVSEIWEEAERRLGSSRYNFSLIYSGHRPFPTDGTLDQPQQLFEIRWKGRGGGPTFKLKITRNDFTWIEDTPMDLKLWECLCEQCIPIGEKMKV